MAGIFKTKYNSKDYYQLAFKTKIYPTEEQIKYFNCCFGIARFAYNWYLDEAEKYYKLNGKNPSYITMRNLFGNMAKTNPKYWFIYSTVNGRVWQQALGNAKSAYNMWFNDVNNKPKKHKKRDSKQSFSTERYMLKSNYRFYIAGINKPNVRKKNTGYDIKTAEDISFLKNVTVTKVTISYNGVNYFASFRYRILKTEFYENDKKLERFYHPRKPIVGIDLGLKTYAVQSDRKVAIFPKKKILELERRINRLNQILSKKYDKNKKTYEQSKNYYRVKTKLNKLYKRKTNIINDFLDKYTTWLVTHYQVIKIEDLRVKSMVKNHKLAKAISRCCFFRFRCMLDYKCKLYGSQLIIIDQFYPSSKLCYCCGNKKQKLSLKERKYICEKCGHEMDRDYNAALNIMEWTEEKNIKNKAN